MKLLRANESKLIKQQKAVRQELEDLTETLSQVQNRLVHLLNGLDPVTPVLSPSRLSVGGSNSGASKGRASKGGASKGGASKGGKGRGK